MRTIVSAALTLLVVQACLARTTSDSTVAVVYSASGLITLGPGGRGSTVYVHPGTQLTAASELELAEDSWATLLFRDGSRRTFWGPKKVVLSDVLRPTSRRSAVGRLLERISKILQESRQQAQIQIGAVRAVGGVGERFYLITPRRTRLRYAATVFAWKRVPSGQGYLVSILDEDYPVYRQTTRDTTVVVFPDSIGLLRGKRYCWKVEVVGLESQLWDSSWFRILSQSEERDGLLSLHQVQNSAPLDPIIEMATLETQGMYHEAFRLVRRQMALEPENPIWCMLAARLVGTRMGLEQLARGYARKANALSLGK